MMNVLYVLGSIAIGFALCAAIFGLTVLVASVCKGKLEWAGGFSMQFVGAVFLAVLWKPIKFNYSFCTPSQLGSLTNWLLFAAGVLGASAIVNIRRNKSKWKPGDIALSMLEGACMEVPQRLLMQTLVLTLLTVWGVPHSVIWACIVNAIIWCMGITAQTLIQKEPFDDYYAIEMTASFLFSIFIGLVFIRSNMILFPVLAHASQRGISMVMNNMRVKEVPQKAEM